MLKEIDPEAYQLLVALCKWHGIDRPAASQGGPETVEVCRAARAFLAAQEKGAPSSSVDYTKCMNCGHNPPHYCYSCWESHDPKPAAEPETAEALLGAAIHCLGWMHGGASFAHDIDQVHGTLDNALAKLRAQRQALEKVADDLERYGYINVSGEVAARIRKALG